MKLPKQSKENKQALQDRITIRLTGMDGKDLVFDSIAELFNHQKKIVE